ncbi:MAG: 3'-5' exonuclease [Owenweeksia sp.]|nr:3'-5' exonuclease [Owenweeksia sp.]
MFAVVDVETTGGHASGHCMTEIAIVIHDGLKVVDQYSTLLNPGRAIPIGIQSLTGISPEMVEKAPFFGQVAQEVHDFLGSHIFVAHNVNFDYAFVKAALADCGIDYKPRRLCSVRFARRIEKGLRSYSLSNLCKHFNVSNEAAHRAWGDASATAQILGYLLEKDTGAQWQQLIKMNSGEFNLPAHLSSQDYHSLPEVPGVYYF